MSALTAPVGGRRGLARELPAQERVKIHEVFYSLQGESTWAGRPCVLVRLTGCQMRCRWCDTEYAFYDGGWWSLDEVVAEVAGYECDLVEVTGGEPLLQPGCVPLMRRLCDLGYTVLLETGGGLDISAVDSRVHRILDVKCPGSGEAENNHWQNLALLGDRDEVKFVIADRADFEWTCEVVRRHELTAKCAVHVSPVWGEIEPAVLAAWIKDCGLPVRLQIQLHKLLWGVDTRGV